VFIGSLALAGVLDSGCHFIKSDELNQAALAGDRTRCEAILSKGANVNGAGMHDMKPIMSAARGGSLETVRFLASKGADVNAHNDSGSALMWAVGSGNEELLRFLLMRGADAGWTNALGRTAHDIAVEEGKTSLVSILETWPKRAEPNGAANAAAPSR
jgi:ankyrin repeat protein